jgi:hypothetical protein
MARYPESKAVRVGRALLARRNPRSSRDFDDVEVIEYITGSRQFAEEFCAEFGGVAGLRKVQSPHDLRRLPSTTETIVCKMCAFYEGVTRVILSIYADESSSPKSKDRSRLQ